MANGKRHFGPTDRNDQTGHSGPPSKLVPNIPVGPNRNGPFHLMNQPKFPDFWVEWKAPKVSYDFLLHGLLHEYFLYLVSAPPGKPRRRCEPEEGYLRCSKRFDHRSHSIIFLLFEFKSVDDVGAGKLREMLTLHTNPHAVHGRFTLKDDCERQVWNAGAAS